MTGKPVGEKSLRWYEEQQHALTVPCPAPPHGCNRPAGQPCDLTGPPAHPARITAADRAAPDTIPAPLPEPREPDPVPRLIDARKMRAELADHRQACEYCNAAIVWAHTTRGDPIPIDADPHDQGDLWVNVTSDTVQVHRLPAGRAAGARAHGQRLHRPHRDSCPKRRLWSRIIT